MADEISYLPRHVRHDPLADAHEIAEIRWPIPCIAFPNLHVVIFDRGIVFYAAFHWIERVNDVPYLLKLLSHRVHCSRVSIVIDKER